MAWYYQAGLGIAGIYLLYFLAGVILSGYIQADKPGAINYLKNVHVVPLFFLMFYWSELIDKEEPSDGWD